MGGARGTCFLAGVGEEAWPHEHFVCNFSVSPPFSDLAPLPSEVVGASTADPPLAQGIFIHIIQNKMFKMRSCMSTLCFD